MATAPKTLSITTDFQVDTRNIDAALERLRDVGERMQIMSDVNAEIDRARRKHGSQHDTPMGTGSEASYAEQLDHAAVELGLYTDDDFTLDCLTNAQLEQCAKHVCQVTGDSWVKILGEEFFEAAAADDPAELDAELVQTIAMGVSMLQAHRRQRMAAEA